MIGLPCPQVGRIIQSEAGDSELSGAQGTATSVKPLLAFPTAEFRRLRAEGLLAAPLTEKWAAATETHARMLDVLRHVGARNLSAGRLYEGHVNALMLIAQYGDAGAAGIDVQQGRVFGVWNTDAPDGVKARLYDGAFHFTGRKAFGSGAGTLACAIVTAEVEGDGRLMFLLPLDTTRHSVDFSSWRPLGMEGSDSFTVDFTGAVAPLGSVLGRAGDYYRQPAFSGGAVRFAAVQLGAIERLADSFLDWIQQQNRTGDPFQQARAGEVAIAVETGRQWIVRAAVEADLNYRATEEPGIGRMTHVANMTRLAIERIGLEVMELVTRGVGARGLLAPAPFEQQLRDLVMYLRQPAPDQALAEVGRQAFLRK